MTYQHDDYVADMNDPENVVYLCKACRKEFMSQALAGACFVSHSQCDEVVMAMREAAQMLLDRATGARHKTEVRENQIRLASAVLEKVAWYFRERGIE